MSDQPKPLQPRPAVAAAARVALTRTGVSIATSDQLQFQLDHALARDAVHGELNVAAILEGLRALGFEAMALRSAVPAGAGERQTYLRRPDLGRRLDAESTQALQALADTRKSFPEVIFCIADGLSALAVERHAVPLMQAIARSAATHSWSLGPVCVVSQGRVAIADEIGELLGASLTVMLIGERPGLSSADSLGAYLTWNPRLGRTDAERNCISNIRGEGLSPLDAAARIIEQIHSARRSGATGVALPLSASPAPRLP